MLSRLHIDTDHQANSLCHQTRDAKYDVLRMLAMFMIVCGHFVHHGIRHLDPACVADVGFGNSAAGQVNFVLCQLMGYLTNIGPALFVLITGYFLVRPRPFRYSLTKLLHLWGTMVFYGLCIFTLFVTLGGKTFTFTALLVQLLPFYENAHWFMTMYAALLLLSPYLAHLASGLQKREYEVLLAVLLVLNFSQEGLGYGRHFSGGMSLFFFIFVFLVGGYVRQHQPHAGLSRYGGWGYLAVCLALTAVSAVSQLLLHHTAYPQIRMLANNSVPLFTAVSLFMWFHSLPPMHGRWARRAVKAAPYVLAVYLIHDNEWVRPWLWNEVVRPQVFIARWWLVPYGLLTCGGIMVVCMVVDRLRQTLFDGVGSLAVFVNKKLKNK